MPEEPRRPTTRNLVGLVCGAAIAAVAVLNFAAGEHRFMHALHFLLAGAIIAACWLDMRTTRGGRK